MQQKQEVNTQGRSPTSGKEWAPGAPDLRLLLPIPERKVRVSLFSRSCPTPNPLASLPMTVRRAPEVSPRS